MSELYTSVASVENCSELTYRARFKELLSKYIVRLDDVVRGRVDMREVFIK